MDNDKKCQQLDNTKILYLQWINNILINCCLTSTLAVFQLYLDVVNI
jgi:hypothetical protein